MGSDFNVGSTVEYKCARGYKLHGPAISVCKKHGTWTVRPVCVGKFARTLMLHFYNKHWDFLLQLYIYQHTTDSEHRIAWESDKRSFIINF